MNTFLNRTQKYRINKGHLLHNYGKGLQDLQKAGKFFCFIEKFTQNTQRFNAKAAKATCSLRFLYSLKELFKDSVYNRPMAQLTYDLAFKKASFWSVEDG